MMNKATDSGASRTLSGAVACPRWISVMPLNGDNAASVSDDAVMLGDETIIDGIAWSFAIHPAGNPVDDKASRFAVRYREAEKLIRPRSGVSLGILLQATMGHGGEPGAPFHNYGKDLLHIVEMRSKYARQLATVGEGAILMQEADTCPHTLWMCSATRLFDHMVMLALDGVKGAKIWITRTGNNHERRSGRNYRRIFRENKGLMQWTADVDYRQGGVVIPSCGPSNANFGDLYLGLIGVPYRFGKARKGDIVALTAATLEKLTDDEIDEILSGKVIADGTAAIWLSAHGRSADIGVDAKSWKLKTVQFHEFADGHRQSGMRVNVDTADLTQLAEGARVLSRLFNRPSIEGEPVYLAPGAVAFDNARGGSVVTLAQPLPPAVPISYAQTLLSETYKQWIVGLLRELGGGLPGGAYYLGDGPATFLSGKAGKDGDVFVLNLLDLDGDDAPEIEFDEPPSVIERLRGDGEWENVEFSRGEGNAIRLSSPVRTQIPAIFRRRR